MLSINMISLLDNGLGLFDLMQFLYAKLLKLETFN